LSILRETAERPAGKGVSLLLKTRKRAIAQRRKKRRLGFLRERKDTTNPTNRLGKKVPGT